MKVLSIHFRLIDQVHFVAAEDKRDQATFDHLLNLVLPVRAHLYCLRFSEVAHKDGPSRISAKRAVYAAKVGVHAHQVPNL
jgi:hypothetical protein